MYKNPIMSIYNRFQQIHVLLDDGDRRALANINLTPTQYNLLFHLKSHAEEKITISQLADMLICTRSNATRLVQRLEEQKLVQLERGEADRRLVWVSITDEGNRLFDEAMTAHVESVVQRLHLFNEETLLELDQLTKKVVASLEEHLAQNPVKPHINLDSD